MTNTFTQLYIHIIFSTKHRQKILPKEHKDEIQKYITGIIQNRNHKLIAINNVADHIHIFVGINPGQSISDLVKEIKTGSTRFINETIFKMKKFAWQDGYAAFSYSRDAIDNVYHYIMNQEEHHRKATFEEEYVKFLNDFGIAYELKYVFD